MRPWVAVLLAFGGVIVFLLAAVLRQVWRHPLQVSAWLSRRALRRAGLVARTVPGPEGRLVVWEGGSGPRVVLLHGAGDQAGAWAKIVRPLVRTFTVVIPDLPGHGGSDPADGPITVGMEIRGVETVLMDTPDRTPAILVGNSLGAWVASMVAFERPDLVSRLVLVNGGPVRGDAPPQALQPSNRAEARHLATTLMGSRARTIPGFVLNEIVREAHVGPLGRLASTADGMETYLLDGRLKELRAPTDLLWGAEDGLFPVSYARRIVKQLPAARLTTLERCGHVPHRQCPTAFTAELLKILASPPPAAKGGDDRDQC